MNFKLTHFTLFPPDELRSYWFISHDFAELLGLQFSKEAATAIQAVVEPRGVEVEYEADSVTLRIKRKELVVATLLSLYEAFGWDDSEIQRIFPLVESFKRPRPRVLSPGDVFTVPVATDLVGLGQILEMNHKSPTVAIFTRWGPLDDYPLPALARSKLLTVLHTTGLSLYKGEWSVVGSVPPFHDPASGPGGKIFELGSKSYGGDGPILELLGAAAGRRSWSEGFHDPDYLRNLVLG
jgi:hypothetical protein